MKSLIKFLDEEECQEIKYTFAILLARYQAKWLFVRHKDRTSWELPAGHVEKGETVTEAAVRELIEETGASEFGISPLVSYRGQFKGETVYGKLFYAKVKAIGELPDFEIAEVKSFDDIPDNLTYPDIQPVFIDWYLRKESGFDK